MLIKNIFCLSLLYLILTSLKGQNYYRPHRKSVKQTESISKSARQEQRNFHEVDDLGDNFVDFGAQTGDHGQFSWHADFPIE